MTKKQTPEERQAKALIKAHVAYAEARAKAMEANFSQDPDEKAEE